MVNKETTEQEELLTEEPQEEESLQDRVNKLEDQLLRCQADFDNYRKRMTRDRENITAYANTTLLTHLLPVLDNFEYGFQTLSQNSKVNTQSFIQGMNMIYQQLVEFIKKQQAVVIAPDPGEVFDPQKHQAISQQLSLTIPPGHIVQTVRKGYMLHDRLLRAADVIVCQSNDSVS